MRQAKKAEMISALYKNQVDGKYFDSKFIDNLNAKTFLKIFNSLLEKLALCIIDSWP